jgi:hypothetical protein
MSSMIAYVLPVPALRFGPLSRPVLPGGARTGYGRVRRLMRHQERADER